MESSQFPDASENIMILLITGLPIIDLSIAITKGFGRHCKKADGNRVRYYDYSMEWKKVALWHKRSEMMVS